MVVVTNFLFVGCLIFWLQTSRQLNLKLLCPIFDLRSKQHRSTSFKGLSPAKFKPTLLMQQSSHLNCVRLFQGLPRSKGEEFYLSKRHMKNVLIHGNDGDPIYIRLSSEGSYHVVHQDSSISSHHSISLAIASAMNQYSISDSRGFLGWQIIK